MKLSTWIPPKNELIIPLEDLQKQLEEKISFEEVDRFEISSEEETQVENETSSIHFENWDSTDQRRSYSCQSLQSDLNPYENGLASKSLGVIENASFQFEDPKNHSSKFELTISPSSYESLTINTDSVDGLWLDRSLSPIKTP